MLFSLALWFLVCSLTYSSPVGTSSHSNSSQTQVDSFLPEIISKIAKLSDSKTCAMIGMASKELNKITENRNKKNRLLEIKEYCGLKKYLDLTLNGHILFINTNNDSRPSFYNHEVYKSLIYDANCNVVLRNVYRDISDQFNRLTIRLPSSRVVITLEMQSALEFYLKTLDELIKRKSSFSKVIVISLGGFGPRYLRKSLEDKLIRILNALTINELVLQVKLRDPTLLMNPTVMYLSAQEEFYRGTQSNRGLPNLVSIFVPSDFGTHPSTLKIARSSNITDFGIPKHLVAEVLSDRYSIDTLDIYDSSRYNNRNHVVALMNTDKLLKGLSIDWNVCPFVSDMSSILLKFKPSLESISVTLDLESEYGQWTNLLRTVLYGNTILKDLSVHLKSAGEFNHSFLREAVNLESYSYNGVLLPESLDQSLFDFVSSQSSLKYLSLEFLNVGTESIFFSFYEKLVAAMQINPSIVSLELEYTVNDVEIGSFGKLFMEKTRPLVGRELLINSIPVENIVSDLAIELDDFLGGNNF